MIDRFDVNDLAIRAARAEIQRDAAIARAETAEDAYMALAMADTETMLDTIRIRGIPARDLKDIYEVIAEWNRNGGRPELLALYRELAELRAKAGA